MQIKIKLQNRLALNLVKEALKNALRRHLNRMKQSILFSSCHSVFCLYF